MVRCSHRHVLGLVGLCLIPLVLIYFKKSPDHGLTMKDTPEQGRPGQKCPPVAPCTCPGTQAKQVAEEHGKAPNKTSAQNIFILTWMRTGSSFFGQIFAQNEDMFYLFEPDWVLHHNLELNGGRFIQPLFVEMLKKLYRCDTSDLGFYISWFKNEPPRELFKKLPRVAENICSSETKCGPVTHENFEKACRETKNKVVKSIRITDIGMLDALIEDPEIDLKIIHLVRDPRAMVASRVVAMDALDHTSNKLEFKSFTDEMITYLFHYCYYNVDDQIAGYYLPKYSDRYLLVRYEDMAIHPLINTQKIYNFLGLGRVPARVSKWLVKNTRTHDPDIFSTTRVSNQVYQSWRTKMNLETIRAIENMGLCGKMMELSGYLPVKNDNHLKNLSAPLLEPVPKPHNDGTYVLI